MLQDKIKGSLIGGAVGDALGYPVEFMRDSSIFKKYGERGITEYVLEDGVAVVSDDTQMTMFTAEALIRAKKKYKALTVDNCSDEIYESYLDWLDTQKGDFNIASKSQRSALLKNKRMYAWRAPGHTCLSALESGKCGTLEYRINNSKGCGGVMRIAPVPLMLYGMRGADINTADLLSARAAAITHGHLLGFVPAAFISHMIWELLDGKDMRSATASARAAMGVLFGKDDQLDYFDSLIDKAVKLSEDTDIDELEAIRSLGAGFVAEETAAISVYCALRFSDSFENAVVASVNHDGDSDSTGAVTGNLMGAYLGYAKIPKKFIANLEFADELTDMAKRLGKRGFL